MSRSDPQHWRQMRMLNVGPIRVCQWFTDWESRTKCEKPSQEGYSFCPEHKKRCYVKYLRKKSGQNLNLSTYGDFTEGRARKLQERIRRRKAKR